jgi:cholesterol transport system auxiliary component
MLKKISWLFLLLSLSACSLFSPVPGKTTNTYLLSAVPSATNIKKNKSTLILLVAPVQSLPAYNTNAIAYTTKPYQLAYFANNHWAATPAQMLQPLIIQTLQNTHYFSAVISATVNSHYDRVLHTQLLQLQQDFTQHPSVIRLTLQAQLVNATTNQVIDTKEISITEPAIDNNPYSGVIAANKAVVSALQKLMGFCLANTQ